jgi:hypothetical protein
LAGEVGYALANAREADALPRGVRRERLSNIAAAAEGLADLAQELLEEEEAELFLTDSPSRPQSAASHLDHGSAEKGIRGGRVVRPVSASPSMWARGTVGKRRDTWQAEQAMRRRKQEERGRQLAQACEVRKRQQLAWEQRHAHLAQQNALIREKQERVHARERKPFVVCDEGPWQYRGTGSSAARRGGLFDLERAGRIMRTHDGQVSPCLCLSVPVCVCKSLGLLPFASACLSVQTRVSGARLSVLVCTCARTRVCVLSPASDR